jgi:hypothetical protein
MAAVNLVNHLLDKLDKVDINDPFDKSLPAIGDELDGKKMDDEANKWGLPAAEDANHMPLQLIGRTSDEEIDRFLRTLGPNLVGEYEMNSSLDGIIESSGPSNEGVGLTRMWT